MCTHLPDEYRAQVDKRKGRQRPRSSRARDRPHLGPGP